MQNNSLKGPVAVFVIAMVVLVGYLGLHKLFAPTPDIPDSAAGAPITTDLRNTVYKDGDTIKATPETAVVWQIMNLLRPAGASTTDAGTSRFTGTASFGATGTFIAGLNFGNCTITATANTIAASTTQTVECAATGATVGDNVSINVSTSSPSTFLGLLIQGASASTTAGTITLRIYNGTGATFTWSATASSTWFSYRALR